MSTTMTPVARKTLANQLDRLDAILDGLAEAIPEVVADAVRVGVQNALAEILAKPEVLTRLHEAAPQRPAMAPAAEAPARTSRFNAVKVRMQQWSSVARSRCERIRMTMFERLSLAHAWVSDKLALARRWGKAIVTALGVGSTVAMLAYLAGPLVGSAICAVSVFVLSLIASAQVAKSSAPFNV